MHYTAVVTKEGKQTLAEFPGCPGCQTFAVNDMPTHRASRWIQERAYETRDHVPTAPIIAMRTSP